MPFFGKQTANSVMQIGIKAQRGDGVAIFVWALASGREGLREPHVGAKRAKHERTVLRSKNKGTKCTFVVSEPQHQLWVQWGMWRPVAKRRGTP